MNKFNVLLSNLYNVTFTDMSTFFFLMAPDSFSLMIISLNKESKLDEFNVSFSRTFTDMSIFFFLMALEFELHYTVCHQWSSINDVILCH